VEKVGSSLFNIVDSRVVGSISISPGSGSRVLFSDEKVVVSFIAMRRNVQTVLAEGEVKVQQASKRRSGPVFQFSLHRRVAYARNFEDPPKGVHFAVMFHIA